MTVRLSKVMTEATMTYNLQFSQGFDWTLGGKLPGLCSEGMVSTQSGHGRIAPDRGKPVRLNSCAPPPHPAKH
jgi:hypothetical protein